MNYNQLIEKLLEIMEAHPRINSTGYGPIDQYSVSKMGDDYMRSFISPIEVSSNVLQATLVVTDKLPPDQKERLLKESLTLTSIKELVLHFQKEGLLKYDDEHIYTPTGLYREDQTIGWKTDIELVFNEEINICKEEKKDKWKQIF